VITAANLTKRYGRVKAVDDVSFTVNDGEAVALWGPNGAGKTTVIRCALGLLPFHGQLVVAGHDIRREGKAARRAIGYVPQELALYDDFRLLEALRFFARLKRAPRDRAPDVLSEVGLENHRRKRIRELSGGMKQRMALAVALLADPPLLVLDELTANLDSAAQGGFMALLRRLKSGGKTILFTSHHATEVRSLADRVLGMKSGRLDFECTPDKLRGETSHLEIFVDASALDDAVSVLNRSGFTALRNGCSVKVAVAAGENAGPILALSRADIDVRNVEIDTRAEVARTDGGIGVE
jgi:ABC-type multidrug transport system ATPase subunit